jgi:hypothetical protein
VNVTALDASNHVTFQTRVKLEVLSNGVTDTHAGTPHGAD